jgi:uncharacterized protein (DUF4415 family)
MNVSNGDISKNWVDPDDAPELTDEWFAKADLMQGEKVVRRGRPRGSKKEQVTVRLDSAVLARLRADGPGWQTRMNDLLHKALGV